MEAEKDQNKVSSSHRHTVSASSQQSAEQNQHHPSANHPRVHKRRRSKSKRKDVKAPLLRQHWQNILAGEKQGTIIQSTSNSSQSDSANNPAPTKRMSATMTPLHAKAAKGSGRSSWPPFEVFQIIEYSDMLNLTDPALISALFCRKVAESPKPARSNSTEVKATVEVEEKPSSPPYGSTESAHYLRLFIPVLPSSGFLDKEKYRLSQHSRDHAIISTRQNQTQYPHKSHKFYTEKDLESDWSLMIPIDRFLAMNELKHLIREGVPEHRIRQTWLAVSGAAEFLSGPSRRDYYDRTTEKIFGPTLPSSHAKFPTFGCHMQGGLQDHCLRDSVALPAIQRLLIRTHAEHSDVEYCPTLVDLYPMLLSHMTEKEAFIVGHILLLQARHVNAAPGEFFYLCVGKKSEQLFIHTFDDLFRKHCPKLYKYMLSLGVHTPDFAENWFQRLFVGSVNYSMAVEIFSIWLCEGSKILYRVGLGLLKVFEYFSSSTDLFLMDTSREHFLSSLQTFVRTIDMNLILEVGFSLQLSRKGFSKHDKKNFGKVETLAEPHVPVYYRPKMPHSNNFLNSHHIEILWSFLPTRHRIQNPTTLFCSRKEGYSLKSMLRVCADKKPLILILKTTDKNIFGVYCQQGFQKPPSGSTVSSDREGFLFALDSQEAKYGWQTGQNDNFMMIEEDNITFGIGGNGVGLKLNSDLSEGLTQACDTFNSKPLNQTESFKIANIDVWGLKG